MTALLASRDESPSLTAREVRERLRRDRERLRAHYDAYGLPRPALLGLDPSYLSVYLYRWSAYHFRRGRPLLARLLWHVNLFLTGADISMISDIGGGLIILHPVATSIFGRIGKDCTLWGHNGIGGGVSNQDIGAGPGLPIVGNGVSFGARAEVLGPWRIGDNCVLEPGVIVTRNVPPDSVLAPAQNLKAIALSSFSGDAAHGGDGNDRRSA